MKEKEEVLTVDEPQVETAEDIQKQIEDLEKKRQEALEREEEEESEKVEMPVASILLKVGRGNEFRKTDVTPAEVALLVAMHQAKVGGNPVANIVPTSNVTVDPITLKRFLADKYSAGKVEMLFPGPIPRFPLKFLRAVKMGLGITLAPERLLDFKVQPMTAGD